MAPPSEIRTRACWGWTRFMYLRAMLSLLLAEKTPGTRNLLPYHIDRGVGERACVRGASAGLRNLHEKLFVAVVKTGTAPATPARGNLERSDVAATDEQAVHVCHTGVMLALDSARSAIVPQQMMRGGGEHHVWCDGSLAYLMIVRHTTTAWATSSQSSMRSDLTQQRRHSGSD